MTKTKRGGLGSHDYVALLLFCIIGLFWIRLVFLYSLPFNGQCAEGVESYGLIETGWLKGWTVYTAMFWVATLASVYAFVLLVAAGRARFSVTAFRLIVIVGLLAMAKLMHVMAVPDPDQPNAIVPVDFKASPAAELGHMYSDTIPIADEDFPGLGDFADVQQVCYFSARRTIVLPVRTHRADLPDMADAYFSLDRGAFFEAWRSTQVYHVLSDVDQAAIESYIALPVAERPLNAYGTPAHISLGWAGARADGDYRIVR